MTTGDFNGDGISDLAVPVAEPSTTVNVLMGNGDGTFQARREIRYGNQPFSIAVGDFNGDGNLDLAVENLTGNSG